MQNIVVASTKEWNISNYFELKKLFRTQYNFHLISNKDELTQECISDINPLYIFFPHWSYLIPQTMYEHYNCIVFHMTDLPFGRGGSPLQNLIIRGIYETKISAIEVTKELDSGAIYLKEDVNIAQGSAQENFIHISNIIFEKMIPQFLTKQLTPVKQTGTITVFKRRKPQESNIDTLKNYSLAKIYDFIRMLDAEGYPKAYIDFDTIKIEFSEIKQSSGKLIGTFEVKEHE